MARAAPWLLALAGLFACQPKITYTPFPEVPPTGSLIVGLPARTGLQVRAFDGASGERMLDVDVDGLTPGEPVAALVYQRPLSYFGLHAGPLAFESSGQALATADASYVLDIGERDVSWRSERVPDLLMRFRYAGLLEDCATFSLAGPFDAGDGYARALLRIDEQHALLAMSTLKTLVVDKSGLLELPQYTYAQAFAQTEAGTVWLAEYGGEIVRARATLNGLEMEDSLPAHSSTVTVTVLAAGEVSGQESVVAFSNLDGLFFSWHDGSWSPGVRLPSRLDAMVWLGPDEALLYQEQGADVIHVLDGQVTTELLRPSSGIAAMGRISDDLVYAIGGEREIYRRQSGRWTKVHDGSGFIGGPIQPYNGSIIYFLLSGQVGEINPSAGLCPEQNVLPPCTHAQMARLGRDLIVAGRLNSVPKTTLLSFMTRL